DQVDGVAQVRCWGDNRSGQATAPDLLNPTAVSAGGAHSCAIYSGGMACWGNSEATSVPAGIVAPRMISAGYDHTCTLDANGATCWGGYSETPLAPAPTLVDAAAIASGAGFSCALHRPAGETQVICWGSPFDDPLYGAALPDEIQNLTNPVALAAGGDRA